MSEVLDLLHIIDKISEAKDRLSTMRIAEKHKELLYDALHKMTKNPRDHMKIFTEYAIRIIKQDRLPDEKKKRMKLSIADQRQHLERFFLLFENALREMEKQLQSMQGKWYFSINKDIIVKNIQVREPNLEVFWDHGFSREIVDKVIFKKKDCSENLLTNLLELVRKTQKDIPVFLSLLHNSLIGEDVPKQKMEELRVLQNRSTKFLQYANMLYSIINDNFLEHEFPMELLWKELDPESEDVKNIEALLNARDVSYIQRSKNDTEMIPMCHQLEPIMKVMIQHRYKDRKKLDLLCSIPEMERMEHVPLSEYYMTFSQQYQEQFNRIKSTESALRALAELLGS